MGRYEELSAGRDFLARHIGPSGTEQGQMLKRVGAKSLDDLMKKVIPAAIRRDGDMALPAPMSEAGLLAEMRELAAQNSPMISLIGQGYYSTFLPPVIQRNVLENPAWYTAYTPYQPEISQGRLEAIFNFQTVVTDLTAMDIANASLLDEATAAAEAMTLCQRRAKTKARTFFVSEHCHPQTIDVVRTRAEPLGIEVILGDHRTELEPSAVFGALLQYPASGGEIFDYQDTVSALHEAGALAVVAADILALTMLTPPGEWGADVVVGSAQRFGVPMGFGGPHAGYFATRDAHKRAMPGRLVGLSIDAEGKPAYRLALQAREQHIRREKATSNICTAQVLLAVMAGLYAAWHGPDGLKRIAGRVHHLTSVLVTGLSSGGYKAEQSHYFDTITLKTGGDTGKILDTAREAGINLREVDETRIGISLDETSTPDIVEAVWKVFGVDADFADVEVNATSPLTAKQRRTSPYLTHPVFHQFRSETEMMRYLRALGDKDIALDRAMIPLGSCTMKLNAAAEMMPVTWPEFADIHPLAPLDQATGYLTLIERLEDWLCAVTGYDAVSLQPNAGSQGEYAGLLAIRAYHAANGEGRRNICLIPSSAHGTNPASAQLAGMTVVVTACDGDGNVDFADLKVKVAEHGENLSALMVTYPSTHGVFEEAITEICEIIHAAGGQVYLDGANLNAQMGLAGPGLYGADVSHLNLHKTFCIPHGGGGPGVGPIGVKAHLAPYLPGHRALKDAPERHRRDGVTISAAPFGSALILPISYAYIRMMGGEGLKMSSEIAILSANYVAARLKDHYEVLYRGTHGFVAHECILDTRPMKDDAGISVDDIAKRLMDYGFHGPTMSWPVVGTLMMEPTESESLFELDRFCDAMIAIAGEIDDVAKGRAGEEDNLLVNAPHTAFALASDWTHPYAREAAVFPTPETRARKYWPPVARVDNAYGDRHLVCSCPPLADYAEAAE